MDRWTGTPEGTRNESCRCFRKRTPFLRGRVQLQGYETERSEMAHFKNNDKRAHIVSSFHFIKKKSPPVGGDSHFNDSY